MERTQPSITNVEIFLTDKIKPAFKGVIDLSKNIRELEWQVLLWSIEFGDKEFMYGHLMEEIQSESGSKALTNCILQQNNSISEFTDDIVKGSKDCTNTCLEKIDEFRNKRNDLLLAVRDVSDTVEGSPRKCLEKNDENEFPKCVNDTIEAGYDQLLKIRTNVFSVWTEVQLDMVQDKVCLNGLVTKWENKKKSIIDEVKECINHSD